MNQACATFRLETVSNLGLLCNSHELGALAHTEKPCLI